VAKVYEWRCPYCNKTISSLYIEQFKNNVRSHLLKHDLPLREVEKLLKEVVG
jgi:uncharacterized protein with PIN domain